MVSFAQGGKINRPLIKFRSGRKGFRMVPKRIKVELIEATSFTGEKENSLLTIRAIVPRYLQQQITRHKRISFSVLSERAITNKRLRSLGFYFPVQFLSSGKGMVSPGKLPAYKNGIAGLGWLLSYYSMSGLSSLMSLGLGLSKQQVNRIIGCQRMSVMVMTGTYDAWLKVLGLRINYDADPASIEFAQGLKTILCHLTPKQRSIHLPFITEDEYHSHDNETLVFMSAARCARTSYGNEGLKKGKKTEKEFANFLLSSQHLSPFEHPANAIIDPTLCCLNSKAEERYKDVSGNIWGWTNSRAIHEKNGRVIWNEFSRKGRGHERS